MTNDFRINRYTTLKSTNTTALELGRKGALPWDVVIAETQTGGRGRLKRRWVSPPGMGLYFSVILRPELAAEEFPKITLAAGLAVCMAIEKACGLQPLIKWPNDLLLAGLKFGGILVESEVTYKGEPGSMLAVLGIGLNINTAATDFPTELQNTATSLAMASGKTFPREPILLEVLDQLKCQVMLLEQGNFAGILKKWRQRDAMVGKSLNWLTPSRQPVVGEALGINDRGLYHIIDASGVTHEVLSGDLTLLNC